MAASKILDGYLPLYTATSIAKLIDAGATDPRQDQHGRVRDGLVERELGLRPGQEPVGRDARARRVERRLGRGRRGRPRALGDRHRHRRIDPPARRAVRHRRHEADLRERLALRDDRVRQLARPGRPAHARRHRRGAAAAADDRQGPVRLDRDRHRPDRPAERREPRRPARSASRPTSPARASTPACARSSTRRCS